MVKSDIKTIDQFPNMFADKVKLAEEHIAKMDTFERERALVNSLAANMMLLAAVECTGGLEPDSTNPQNMVPCGDPTWLDLGDAAEWAEHAVQTAGFEVSLTREKADE